MSATPLFTSRVDWTEWARHAAARVCEGCGTTFQPNHPRRRFCGADACPGRRPTQQPRRRMPSGRQQAAARAAGIQGFLGDVLVEVHRSGVDGSLTALQQAAQLLVRAERCGNAEVARAAITRLCAAGAARAIALVPPVLGDDDELDGVDLDAEAARLAA